MEIGMDILLFLLVLVVVAVFWAIHVRNKIVFYKNAVVRSWSDVNAYALEKLKSFEELAQNVSSYLEHEKSTFESIVALRSSASKIAQSGVNTQALQDFEAQASQIMKGINVNVEQYPDLASSRIVERNMAEIVRLNENMSASISIFNRNVEKFNTYIKAFPNNVINTNTVAEHEITAYSEAGATSQYTSYTPNF